MLQDAAFQQAVILPVLQRILFFFIFSGCGGEPVYEVVLLQVATAKRDVPGHLQQLPHGQRRGLTLEMPQLQYEEHRETHE